MKFLHLITTIVLSGCASIEQDNWDKFSATHNCKVISYTKESSITGAQFVMAGTHIVMIPGIQHIPARSEYLCNDGVRYTR